MIPLPKWNKEGCFVFIVYASLAVLFCSNYFAWTDLESHSMQRGDPALNAWALQWVSKSITRDPLNLFNGNAFHPTKNSIALAEHMFSLGLINTLFRPFSNSPWFGYNLLIFLAYVLSALGAYRLVSYISSSKLIGFWAGIFWGFLYFRVHHIGHLQILSFQWIPYTIYFLLRYIRTGNHRSALGLVCFFTMQALVSWYLATINTLISILVLLSAADKSFFLKPRWKKHIFVLISIGMILAPFSIPYVTMVKASTFSDRMTHALNSGDNIHLIDYLHPPQGTLIGQKIANNRYWIWQENTLYIGYAPLLLSLIFVVVRLARPNSLLFPEARLSPSRVLLMGLALCVGGYVFAKGFTSGEWNIHLPLYYVARAVPFVAGMRATQRFSLMIYFGIMLLSSLGLYTLVTKIKSKTVPCMIVALFSFLYLVEVYPYHLPIKPNTVFSYPKLDGGILEIQSKENRPLAILYLPIFYFHQDYAVEEATYMLGSTLHWAKIVNGFSGEVPNSFGERMTILNTFPSLVSRKLLRELEVDYVALDRRLPLPTRNSILDYVKEHRVGRILSISDNEQLIKLDKSPLPSREVDPFSFPVFLDFTKEYPVSFIAQGFSHREDWGRWTNHDIAVLKLKGFLPEKFKLVLEAFAFGPNTGRPVRIRIGDSEKEIILTNQKSTIHLEFAGVRNPESLTIYVPKPISPQELGISGDTRKL